MPRPVVCRRNLDEVLKKNKDQYIDNGECARLVQVLCPELGYHGRWQRGPRVVDVLPTLAVGTAVANFDLKDGLWVFPSKHGFHAGIYKQNGRGRVMKNGLVCVFTMVDQWRGQYVEERGLPHVTPEMREQNVKWTAAANNADEFYVILVP